MIGNPSKGFISTSAAPEPLKKLPTMRAARAMILYEKLHCQSRLADANYSGADKHSAFSPNPTWEQAVQDLFDLGLVEVGVEDEYLAVRFKPNEAALSPIALASEQHAITTNNH